jgi:hypothetical protein
MQREQTDLTLENNGFGTEWVNGYKCRRVAFFIFPFTMRSLFIDSFPLSSKSSTFLQYKSCCQISKNQDPFYPEDVDSRSSRSACSVDIKPRSFPLHKTVDLRYKLVKSDFCPSG